MIRRRLADDRGSVTMIVASAMFGLIGSAAFAVELSQVYLQQSEDQRIADVAAVAAALAYSQTLSGNNGTTASAIAAGQAAANNFAITNGLINNATVSTSFPASPSGDGNTAALVHVTYRIPLGAFSLMMAGSNNSVGISNSSYAEIKPSGTTACIIALSGSVGLTGGANLTGVNCSVNSDGNVTASGGTHVSASAVYAVGSISTSGGSTITTSPTSGRLYASSPAPSDPLASYTSSAFAQLTNVGSPAQPTAITAFPTLPAASSGGLPDPSPSRSSATYTLPSTGPYSSLTLTNWSGSSWTVNIPAGTKVSGNLTVSGGTDTIVLNSGTYAFGGIAVTGGGTLTTIQTNGSVTLDIYSNGINAQAPFALSVASGSVTVNIVNGGISANASSTFGAGTYNIYGGITTNATTSFGAGTYNIYSGGITINGGTGATFGAGNYNVYGGIADNSSSPVTFGAGNYVVYSGTSSSCLITGAGICVGGGANLTIGNGSNSTFNVTGGIGVSGGATASLDGGTSFVVRSGGITTGGGSNVSLGADPEHDVNGSVTLGGSATLGAGLYYVYGNIAFGWNGSGGGTVSGTSVSLVTSGSFLVDAGYTTVDLVAPTSGTMANVTVSGPGASGATLTGGASNTELQGAFYFPNAPLSLSGSGNLNGAGTCLEIIAASITLTGGSSAGTVCPLLPTYTNTASGAVALVQ